MATQTTPNYMAINKPQPRRRTAQLWQLPMFLLGIGALTGVWYGRPYLEPNEVELARRDLIELRRYVEKGVGDRERALQLAKRAVERVRNGETAAAGEAYFLLGCVNVLKAEDPDAIDAAAFWQEARANFEKAMEAGVPDGDKSRLAFRTAKALHQLNEDPATILAMLKNTPDNVSDDPSERWGLLAETYLRMPQPDLKAALEATRQQLAQMPQGADPRVLSAARFRLADLHLLRNEPAEARRAVERIGSDAPATTFFKARVVQARSFQAEGDFAQAARCWEQAKTQARNTGAEVSRIQYELGICYTKLNRPRDAKDAWETAIKSGGEGAYASAFRLAELQIREANPALAVATLDAAFQSVRSPSDFRSSLLPASDVQKLLEGFVQTYRAAGDYTSARKTADLYAKVISDTRGRQLLAELAEAQALASAADPKSRDESKTLYRQAAADALRAAESNAEGDKLSWIRKAVDAFQRAGDPEDLKQALQLLEKHVRPDETASRDLLLKRAQIHQKLGDRAAAREAFKLCCGPGSPYVARARLHLAALLQEDLPTDRKLATPVMDQIVEELEKNLEPAVAESDKEAHEQSLYRLGIVLYLKQDFLKAQTRLQEALQNYPSSVQANFARFYLGRCFWFLAAKESSVLRDKKLPKEDLDVSRKRYKEYLEKARQPFEIVESSLLAQQQKSELSPADASLLRQASFAAAECCFYVGGEYEEAVRRYNLLALRYRHTVEELIALSQLWQCYQIYLRPANPEKASATLDQFRDSLAQIPPALFDRSSPAHARDHWERWLKDVEQLVEKSKAAP